jgi:hypothetical protein
MTTSFANLSSYATHQKKNDKLGWVIIVLYGNAIEQKDNDDLDRFIVVCNPSIRPRRRQQA